MFVDKVIIHVKAGNGGDGAVSFRHEKYIDKGGPDGGDGGRGGSVILEATRNENTLVRFRFKQDVQAEDGKSGSHRQKRGRSGTDAVIYTPIGTQVYHEDQLIADLTQDGQQAIVARGGDGGFGNAHFKSSTRQAPRVAEVGERGEEKELILELKLLADVGLVGFPNAGKSTFLSVVTNAKPEIGDYPFTTLTPNLGVADIDDSSLLIADIPGLIEGASQGKGLGDAFLRHIERTAVLLHLIDIYEDDLQAAHQTITNELQSYSPHLAKRPRIIALTKSEGLAKEEVAHKKQQLEKVVGAAIPIFVISAQAHQGLEDLLRALHKVVVAERTKYQDSQQTVGPAALPVIALDPRQQADAWRVEVQNGAYHVTGHKIEKFAGRTNFTSEPGLRRLRDIMRKMGIVHELERRGIKAGDTIIIGKHGGHKLTHGR